MQAVTRAAPKLLMVFLVLVLATCDDDDSPGGDGTTAGDTALTETGGHPGDGISPGEPGSGSGKVGDPCTKDSDCAEPPNPQCFTTVGGMGQTVTFPGGYCSRVCGNEDSGTSDCGSGGCAQVTLTGSGGSPVTMSFCAKSCQTNDECRASEGYTCRVLIIGLPGFCAPP